MARQNSPVVGFLDREAPGYEGPFSRLIGTKFKVPAPTKWEKKNLAKFALMNNKVKRSKKNGYRLKARTNSSSD